MAVQVSRLRAAGLAKESVLGTPITTPTRYMNIIPPDSFTPMIEPLPSKGIEALADMYPKITAGPATLNGMKVKLELEPENCGEILQALFGLDTKTGAGPSYTHTFVRQQVSVLPTYTWWFDKNPKYQLIAGCMLAKADIDIKAKGIVELDTDWVGTVYDDTDGSSKSPAFSALSPFTWQNAVVQVDGSGVSGYDHLKIAIDNKVKADHALNNSQFPYTIYSEGMDVQLSGELFFENTTQYQKFLAGTTAHFNIVLTSPTIIGDGVHYSLALDFPLVYYKSQNLYIPSNGPLKVPFVGLCQYSFSGSVYTVQAALVNSIASAY
jgi:Phage tail tube protein